MAFFKFRLPGRVGSDEALASASPAESLEALRRRARQRLMGAAVLVLLAVMLRLALAIVKLLSVLPTLAL